jgi:large subunit ribosomal protein L9
MEILLKKNIEGLGEKDEIVSVKPGYGRNFLIPQGAGILVTDSVRKMHAETLKQRSHKATKVLELAKAAGEKLAKSAIKVPAKVGENGKILNLVRKFFYYANSSCIQEQLVAAGYDVDRKSIKMQEDAIKTTGKYKADVKLHPNQKRSYSRYRI